jgi:ATP-dependent exoDNAse (exonuclease V) alpha subunit
LTSRFAKGTGKTLTFDPQTVRHFDHGYAVTSHSSQGLTVDRVLVNVDHAAHPDLINSRFAYVSLSRASLDARIFTDDVSAIASRLSHEVGKTSAIDFSQTVEKMGNEQNVQSGIHLGM